MENIDTPHYAHGPHPDIHATGPAGSAASGMTHAERLARLERFADLMDSRFTLPGTDIRFGLDGLLGLLPGIGDTVGAIASAWILSEAHHLGAGGWLKFRMAGNIFLDWLVGLVPVFGDIFDIAFKANRRNIALLRRHLARQGGIGA